MTALNSRRMSWLDPVEPSPHVYDDPYGPLKARALEKDRTVLVFDGRLMAFRAFYVHERLAANDGSPTGALHGMLSMIEATCAAANTGRFMVVWDGSRALEYKRRVFPNYKSRHDRQRTPEEMEVYERRERAIKIAEEVFAKLRIPQFRFPQLEADDTAGIIAGLVRRQFSKLKVLLCSDDKDWYQLIADGVDVWRGTQGQYVDRAEFLRRHGFSPESYPDWKAFVGEPATGDNIPGVRGIGEIYATNLIAAHGTWQKAYDAAQLAVRGGKGLKRDRQVAASRDILEVSYKLSRIMRDVTEAMKVTSITGQDLITLKAEIQYGVQIPRPLPMAACSEFVGRYQFDSFDPRAFAASCGFRLSLKDKAP